MSQLALEIIVYNSVGDSEQHTPLRHTFAIREIPTTNTVTPRHTAQKLMDERIGRYDTAVTLYRPRPSG